jgi:hypothetical protein
LSSSEAVQRDVDHRERLVDRRHLHGRAHRVAEGIVGKARAQRHRRELLRVRRNLLAPGGGLVQGWLDLARLQQLRGAVDLQGGELVAAEGAHGVGEADVEQVERDRIGLPIAARRAGERARDPAIRGVFVAVAGGERGIDVAVMLLRAARVTQPLHEGEVLRFPRRASTRRATDAVRVSA